MKQTLWFTELFLTELLPAYWNVLFNDLFSKFILMTCKDAWTSFSLQSGHKILWRVAGFPIFPEVLNSKNSHSLSDFIAAVKV